MSFVLGKKIIKCLVDFTAEGDLGEEADVQIVIVYKRPSSSEAKEFSKLNASFYDALRLLADDGSEMSVADRAAEVDAIEQQMAGYVRDRIEGWDKVFDLEGKALPFNSENLDVLFDDRDARRAVFARYNELASGRKKAAEKNSEKPASDG